MVWASVQSLDEFFIVAFQLFCGYRGQGVEEARAVVTAKGTEQIKFLTAFLLASGVDKESMRADHDGKKGNSLGETTEKEPIGLQ